ncbi:hypothetical protein [Pelagovum pacificum]|uniref:Uncharacterized protein n=2 Tax=Pelagovum pacificum TaxID=2588711 RepID=A0A5C5GKU6_9RHOB|nr:hypothetical protein [Pelagovum pacificum]QQA43457.1 hypothetical protein I8N54_02455 [Pelagovum pacificum]TNY34359.1 hypothetical protein FHY64_09075 [Pelagovum pacificum]
MKRIIALALLASPAIADAPDIGPVEASLADGSWTFDVTLTHPDTGEEHYADAWRVETPDGEVLGTRELLHPHVNEQPFTRSLSGVAIPEDMTEVVIRASCNVDGWADETFILPLP